MFHMTRCYFQLLTVVVVIFVVICAVFCQSFCLLLKLNLHFYSCSCIYVCAAMSCETATKELVRNDDLMSTACAGTARVYLHFTVIFVFIYTSLLCIYLSYIVF